MKFSYVQIGAKDYKALADFYRKALDFTDSADSFWLGGKEGCVLSAPGFPNGDAPVFGFFNATEGAARKINDVGYAHICFETKDVKAAVKRLVANGGSVISTMSNPQIHPCVYCADPEGNIVEFHIPFPAKGTFPEYMTTAGSLLHLSHKKALKFIHVNIITDNWENLCAFYRDAAGCVNSGKLKDHQGNYKAQVIGIPDVHVVGQHVLLKGFYDNYPTLEIFTYSVPGIQEPQGDSALGIDLVGYTSDDLAEDIRAIENAGGSLVSDNGERAELLDAQNDCIVLLKK